MISDDHRGASDWRLEPHVCAACLGRIVSRKPLNEPRVYLCCDCGETGSGEAAAGGQRHPVICACGMKIGARNAGIRCFENERRTHEIPNKYIARGAT